MLFFVLFLVFAFLFNQSGHVLGQTELLERALPALEAQLTQGLSRPLPLTTEMLSQEYREVATGAACVAVACPDCVTAHLTKLVARQEAREEGAIAASGERGGEGEGWEH